MKHHLRATAHIYVTVFAIVFLFVFVFSSCAATDAVFGIKSQAQKTWERVADDGYVSSDEIRSMDDAYEIDTQRGGWLQTLLGYGGELLGIGGPAGIAAVVATNRIRDRRRKQRGEPVAPAVPPAVVISTEQKSHGS